MRAFEYRHTVSFQDTNAVGNVYFTNHVAWQGRCREMFLREHAPEILEDLAGSLRLVTTRVSCDYLEELFAFDEVLVRMYAADLTQSRVTMRFEYFRLRDGAETLVGRGEQQIASMRLQDGALTATPIPDGLHAALVRYR